MRSRFPLILLLVIGVIVGLAAATRWLRRPPTNVILITIDTLRPDRLSAYGYARHKTPNFDRLAKEGVLFENAFCDVTWTTPSMASAMTGHYATVHGVRSSFDQLGKDAVTLAELLQAQHIHTAAIVASYPLASIYGLNRGFDLYDESFTKAFDSATPPAAQAGPPPAAPAEVLANSRLQMMLFILEKRANGGYRTDSEVSDRAIRWLREERGEPFFLWVHYFGPHDKPLPAGTAPLQLYQQSARYDRDVVGTDREVGRLLQAIDDLGLSEQTATILHADHGEELLEHQVFGHGFDVYDVTQRVPMLLRFPGHLPAGRRIVPMARNVDIFPTVLDLMGVKPTAPVDGASLLSLSRGTPRAAPEETYVETYLTATSLFGQHTDGDRVIGMRHRGIRTPQWKFIINDPVPVLDRDDPAAITAADRAQYTSQELYDLRADPREFNNVVDRHPAEAAAFRSKVEAYQESTSAGSTKVELDAASRERLRSLGYLK